jgi:hypothetical protein
MANARVRVIASWQNRSSCGDNVRRVASAAPASLRHHHWSLARDCNNGRIVFASGFGCWISSAGPDLGVAYCDRHFGADGCDRWYWLGVSFEAFRKSVLWVHFRTRDSSGWGLGLLAGSLTFLHRAYQGVIPLVPRIWALCAPYASTAAIRSLYGEGLYQDCVHSQPIQLFALARRRQHILPTFPRVAAPL